MADISGGGKALSLSVSSQMGQVSWSLKTIAVGTAIAGRPPHRSVREELPHTAPALSRSRKRCSGYGWMIFGVGNTRRTSRCIRDHVQRCR